MKNSLCRMVVVAAALGLAGFGAGAQAIDFKSALDNSPLQVPREGVSEAVAGFHETGENPYVGDEAALAEGRKLYKRWCQACHMPDGSGRIGPSFLDDKWAYARTDTMVGRFEIVYGGGAGAMQAFGQRLSQDEILKVLAYVEKLRADAGAK